MLKKSLVFIISLGLLQACSNKPAEPQVCSAQTQALIEEKVSTGDGHGHGPDIGSDEWHGVVEFRLKLRGNSHLPEKNSQQWCDFILKELNK